MDRDRVLLIAWIIAAAVVCVALKQIPLASTLAGAAITMIVHQPPSGTPPAAPDGAALAYARRMVDTASAATLTARLSAVSPALAGIAACGLVPLCIGG